MLSEKRHQQIYDIVNDKKSVTVHELSQSLFVSEATIRRDLSTMEKLGFIRRSHGGAVIFESINDESSILIREQENVPQKKAIAEIASEHIKPHHTIFMDSSSTTGMIIPFLKRYKFLTVITNGLKNALLLSDKTTAKIYMPSGIVSNQSNSILGGDTLDYFSNMNADIALISCSGINIENGITDASFEQSSLKKQMLKKAQVKILLCDSSKFYKTYMCETCDFDSLDYVITDKRPDDIFEKKAQDQGCKIIYP
ncbi:MAG: glpR [Oscillospiraceae bacterium]|jgi:DeoR family fructose operon transcriptional repressor|nr:glpR [Oscillospiraceae bacterium]